MTVQQDYNLAAAHVAALTGDVNTPVDLRMLHDTNKGSPGYPLRGRLADLWPSVIAYQAAGFGCFVVVNSTDGHGVKLPNITAVRAHFADLDDIHTAEQSLAALQTSPAPPQFIVQSSPGKYHAYFTTGPSAYLDQQRFDTIQRKLIARYNGDSNSRDMARVLRLSGTLHLKTPANPYLVTCTASLGWGTYTDPATLEAVLADVQVSETGSYARYPLMTPELAAPTLDFAIAALYGRDPNDMGFEEWISHMAAFRQSASSLAAEQTIKEIFFKWCEQYETNDVDANDKHWRSMDKGTRTGWPSLRYHLPPTHYLGAPTAVPAYYSGVSASAPVTAVQPPPSMELPYFAPGMLSPSEQQLLFKHCTFVTRFGEIWDARLNRTLNASKFNGEYGGYDFVITAESKTTDEPYKAALRSRMWRIPKVDHLRFLPHEAPGALIRDDLGREGLNVYRPANIKRRVGDPSPFINHIKRILPHGEDAELYIKFLAHNAKFPGRKIPWAPLLQSAEGAGKGVIKRVIKHALGGPYVYFPNAKELIESGSKFNGWMRNKLFILVDEIKVDERRDMIEVLKPMISEEEIEIQGKGENQEKEDNYSNWAFFSNYKDAIPVSKNGRRFTIFYSVMQSAEDLENAGMNKAYFDWLYDWLDNGGGKEIVAEYLMSHPVQFGELPMRAPVTTSTAEALEQSRGPLEQLIHELIERKANGFRGGWVAVIPLRNAAKAAGLSIRSDATCGKVLEQMGYARVGLAIKAYQQDGDYINHSVVYSRNKTVAVEQYGSSQGYE